MTRYCMNAIAFDSLKYSQTLQDGGVPRNQADAIARANMETFAALIDSQQLATKQDVIKTKTELKLYIEETKNNLIKWYIGIMVAQTSLIVTAFGVGVAMLK